MYFYRYKVEDEMGMHTGITIGHSYSEAVNHIGGYYGEVDSIEISLVADGVVLPLPAEGDEIIKKVASEWMW